MQKDQAANAVKLLESLKTPNNRANSLQVTVKVTNVIKLLITPSQ